MRRISFTLLIILVLGLSALAQLPSPAVHPMYRAEDYPFFHGVAAGDSRSDGFVIWTKISPDTSVDSIKVSYCVSLTTEPKDVVELGQVYALRDKDYTVKVNVAGLEPFTRYYYWFGVCPQPGIHSTKEECYTSPKGAIKTTPAHDQLVDRLTFVAFTGSNYNAGFFNAYCAAARDTAVDFALHTGDYIYEYGNREYGKNPERDLLRDHELLSLKDYSTRYWLYRMDTCLKKAHQAFGWYTIWDDHEVSNDSWREGAQNHQPMEGNYFARRRAAFTAYYCWMPIAEKEDTEIYRVVDMGRLARLILLDTRHHGRDFQRLNPWDTSKTMLGHDQLQWFFQELLKAQSDSVRWIIVTQQLLFAPLIVFNDTLNRDGWDMYPLEREKILRFIYNHNIRNVVFVGGDFHTSWANELYLNAFRFHSRRRDTMVSMEFVTPAVTSPAAGPLATAIFRAYTRLVPRKHYIRYVDLHHKGYLKLTVLPDKVVAQWIFVRTIDRPDVRYRVFKTYIYQGLPPRSGIRIMP